MKRFFLILFIVISAGYFLTGYFSTPETVTSSQDLLKSKKLQKAFKKIVSHEKKMNRVPASEVLTDEAFKSSGDVSEVNQSEEEETEQSMESTEYDVSEDTFQSVSEELADVKLKINFHKSRREYRQAKALISRMNFLEKKLHYLPETL